MKQVFSNVCLQPHSSMDCWGFSHWGDKCPGWTCHRHSHSELLVQSILLHFRGRSVCFHGTSPNHSRRQLSPKERKQYGEGTYWKRTLFTSSNAYHCCSFLQQLKTSRVVSLYSLALRKSTSISESITAKTWGRTHKTSSVQFHCEIGWVFISYRTFMTRME